MRADQTKRQEHLSLYSPLELGDFCAKFKTSLGLPEMHLEAENETEWGLIEFENIEYNVSRPYEKGTLQEWDDSTPPDCNFGIVLSIHKNHPSANDTKWINDNLVAVVANRLASTFETTVYYHRTWFGIDKNDIKNITFNTNN
ncbi:MAG: hypothetical protein JNL32_05665 [Candidatus Kapabacteria bacterium]|nr:hypothetical protein [Candidatus Kapabacteria bacterium]